PRPRGLPDHARPDARVDVRPRVRRAAPARRGGASRVQCLQSRFRARGGAGMTSLTIAKALTAGLRKAMENDPKVVLMGEDIGKLGGVFRITDGLQKHFGERRVCATRLREAGRACTAVRLSIRGYRPVCEIQFDGFVYPAYDQIVTQVSRMRWRSKGMIKMPMVIRIPYGGGIGAVEHHSESPESYLAHTTGLKVVTCSNPV